MPLIACLDCNRPISAIAAACPGCGRPSAAPARSTAVPSPTFGKALAIAPLLALVLTWFWMNLLTNQRMAWSFVPLTLLIGCTLFSLVRVSGHHTRTMADRVIICAGFVLAYGWPFLAMTALSAFDGV